jgi:hypothetical protein
MPLAPAPVAVDALTPAAHNPHETITKEDVRRSEVQPRLFELILLPSRLSKYGREGLDGPRDSYSYASSPGPSLYTHTHTHTHTHTYLVP